METIIGRIEEKALLHRVIHSSEAELIAVYGRRRVGKTYLIRNTFVSSLVFELSGIHHATLNQQLENFSNALANASSTRAITTPTNWLQAFELLKQYLKPLITQKKAVVFIDEFPWLDTPRSGFIPAFENFWNSWATKEKNLIVVICGSAAAWMIKKVINNRGGLHNRVTRRIRLLPFTLQETAAYLQHRSVKLDHYQVLQLYMALGGIPQYLKDIEPGESAIQVIDRMCFTKDGLLFDEFKNLYNSLFDSAQNHMDIVRALAKKGAGLTRKEIIDECRLTSGGYATKLLDELSESGFITAYIPFGNNRKDALYKLIDEYSLFYLRFIENSKATGAGTWVRFQSGRHWSSWSGFAYESICMKHIDAIKKAIGIADVYTEVSAWRYLPKYGSEKGAQIDLLIDRNDNCINICEMKFSTGAYEITKSYKSELENKLQVFQIQTKTKKTLFLTMITTYGIKNGDSFPGLIQKEISMSALF
ncbi:MAG: AAA family ATPase [Mucilaginibacter sp.]